MRAAWGISCLCLKSPGRPGSLSREPSQDLPGEVGSPSPHSPCTSRKSYTQKHAPLLICAFEVWVHPQHVSQRDIKQVVTPADQLRPPLREKSKLGNQSKFMQGNLCLPFLQLISKAIPLLFKTFWKLKKKNLWPICVCDCVSLHQSSAVCLRLWLEICLLQSIL